jgi:hypothetical protein
MKALVLPLALLLGSCAPSPRPDDMSAAAHRHEAARERLRAQQELAAHDEGYARADPRVPGDPAALIPSEELRPGALPMPGSGLGRLHAAEARAAHAREHDAAAAELERFEAEACAGIPPAARAACPLLVGAGVILDVQGGVEIRFESGAPVSDVYRRMSCHLAFARARGFEGDACPLYVKGLRIERTGTRILRITSSEPAATGDVRRRSRALARPGQPTIL